MLGTNATVKAVLTQGLKRNTEVKGFLDYLLARVEYYFSKHPALAVGIGGAAASPLVVGFVEFFGTSRGALGYGLLAASSVPLGFGIALAQRDGRVSHGIEEVYRYCARNPQDFGAWKSEPRRLFAATGLIAGKTAFDVLEEPEISREDEAVEAVRLESTRPA